MSIFAKIYPPRLNRPFSYAFSERMGCPKGYSGMDTPFAEYMAGIHWDLRKGTKRIDEQGRRRQLQSHGRDIPSEPPSTELYDYEMQHLSHNAPGAIPAATCWTTSVTESGSSAYSQLVDASCYNRATANFQPLDAQAIFIGYNADECRFFECPNTMGEYDCPYSTIYDVPDRYEYASRYGYEHLPVSSNPQGWTFENTGCRLYGLGLKSLTPPASEDVIERVADERVESAI
ncbi:hypothetical protein B0H11DRAFT_646075 [Mycena galericulata]|nr:hypothetical protein B0H11DRAFT_646075 [Mycena galericulata]